MLGNGGRMAKLDKPDSIAANPFKSQKWDEVTAGRTFSKSDIPTLVLLCHWYAVADKCMDTCEIDGEMRVAYMNEMGDIKAMPQIGTLKQASAEIRALNKQLGINDEAHAETRPKETKLYAIQGNRRARAANKGSAAAR